MRLSRAALLLGAALLPLAATAKTAPKPRPAAPAIKPIASTERTLANGLRVYAIRDTTTPNVSVQVWYDVGSKNDPPRLWRLPPVTTWPPLASTSAI